MDSLLQFRQLFFTVCHTADDVFSERGTAPSSRPAANHYSSQNDVWELSCGQSPPIRSTWCSRYRRYSHRRPASGGDSRCFRDAYAAKKIPVEYTAQKRHAEKQIILNEEVELGASKPAIHSIIRQTVQLEHTQESILAGKIILKGEAAVHILYAWKSDTESEPESTGLEHLAFSIPYSQIIDIDQIDENYRCHADIDVIRCELKPVSSKPLLQCEIELFVSCTAVKPACVQLVTDAFSTRYPCEQTTVPLQVDRTPTPIQATFSSTMTIPPGDTVPECIYDISCSVRNINTQLIPEQNRIRISGMLCCRLLAKDSEDALLLLEKEEAFESYVDQTSIDENATLQAEVQPIDSTYHLSTDGTISIQATLSLTGQLCPCARFTCLSELEVDSENKLERDGDYALKLYYGVEQEQVWDIAKRCRTSVNAIMEENNLSDEALTASGMLLIPIVH